MPYRANPSLARFLRPPAQRTLVPRLHQQRRPALGQAPVTLFSSSSRLCNSKDGRPQSSIDREAERKLAQQKLESDPARVSIDSSTRPLFEEHTLPGSEPGVNEGVKHDLNIVREAFRLGDIPKESHLLGLAGTVPYLATSMSTLYLGWDLAKTYPTGSSIGNIMFTNHDKAQHMLSILEPVQLGYGAMIISFLGAIHWVRDYTLSLYTCREPRLNIWHQGLEYAEKAPLADRTRFRYAMGVAAPAVAWPTLYLPIEFGLTVQFAAFVGLYFADSQACKRGWTPPWYGHYRFLLTAMVGIAIGVSLVGRAEIEKSKRLSVDYLRSSMGQPGLADTETDWVKVEAEEKERKRAEEKEKKESKSDEKDGEKHKGEGKGDDPEKSKKDDGKKDGKRDNKDNKKDESQDAGDSEKKEDGKGDNDKEDEGKRGEKGQGRDDRSN
ncbi:Protein of unknown function (DUF3429) [Geosmithia morbida]|uniref:Mitochondrial inner membrane protein 1 n=1 Tax=Geosmithia morbida TaxID=1094350 RepID=A0A9P4YS01_9HYPO|nr:Protein of unknown function (DUF3429) [Geosmithia morbida]KAF4122046.1 Protein of unknown function (DUF3429) [Geosmithia morbida]